MSIATFLIIVGLVLVGIGLIVFLLPPGEETTAQAVVGEFAEVIKQVTALLDKLEKRYRPGLMLMLIGLTLVGCGVYLESVDAKNAAKQAAATSQLRSKS